MAKVLTSPLITDIRQKIGSAVFQGTLGGTMVRTQLAAAKKTDTAAQYTKAIYLAALGAWQATLSASDRNNWNIFASAHPIADVFGNNYFLSGFDAFMKYTIPLLRAGGAVTVTPPASITVTQPTAVTASADSGAAFIEIDSLTPNIASGESLVIQAQGYTYPWRAVGKARRATIQHSAGPLTFPVDFTVAYLKKFGAFQANSGIAIAVYVVSSVTGAKSTPLNLTIVTT